MRLLRPFVNIRWLNWAVLAAAFTAGAAGTMQIFGREWTVPVASDWKADLEDGVPVLRLLNPRGPAPGPRRPLQFALAATSDFDRVSVTADVKPLGKSLLIVFAYRDQAHFNYAHLSIDTGANEPFHNGIFHVYGGERVRISSQRGPASFGSGARWYHVELTHDAGTGTVGVTVDGETIPALRAVDLSLGAGRIGLGSFDETGIFRNVKVSGTAASPI